MRFERVGDRWHHSVTVRGSPSVAWRSVEGPAGDDARWPASPAFVEVTRLGATPDAPLMAVGQAGRTHFSAVVLADAAAPGTIRFDVAARIHDTPLGLGSTYARIPGGGPVDSAGPPPLRVVPDPDGETLPRTCRWSYRFGPEGLVACGGASLVAVAGSDPRDRPMPA